MSTPEANPEQEVHKKGFILVYPEKNLVGGWGSRTEMNRSSKDPQRVT